MSTTIWQVEYEGRAHTVRLEYNVLLSTISIFLDDRPNLNNKFYLYLSKNFHQFTENGHFFAFQRAITAVGLRFSLSFDGHEIPPISTDASLLPNSVNTFITHLKSPSPAPSPAPQPFTPSSQPVPAPSIQIVGQGPLTETTEIVARDEYPLDNRFGGEILSIEQEVSRTVANEISLSHEMQVSAGGNFELFSYIKADLSAQFTRQTGVKVNGTVTRRQTIKFSAGAHQFVVYSVIWKRRVSEGTCYVSMQNTVQPIPYRVAFDLSFEITSRLGAT